MIRINGLLDPLPFQKLINCGIEMLKPLAIQMDVIVSPFVSAFSKSSETGTINLSALVLLGVEAWGIIRIR